MVNVEDYWRFGRVLAQLGIWYQFGLVLAALYVLASRHLANGGWYPLSVAICVAVEVKNLALYRHCKRTHGADWTGFWIASLCFDVVVFVVVLPITDPLLLRDSGSSLFFGLHYALAACLRWRQKLVYVSLLVPIAFFVVALVRGVQPRDFSAATALFVLGFVFIVATRVGFVRDARTVERLAAEHKGLERARALWVGEFTSVASQTLSVHEGFAPLRALGGELRSAGASEVADRTAGLELKIRAFLGAQVDAAMNVDVITLLGSVAEDLAKEGIEFEFGRWSLPERYRASETEHLKSFVRAMKASYVNVQWIHSVGGRPALLMQLYPRPGDGLLSATILSDRAERSSDGSLLIYYLRPI